MQHDPISRMRIPGSPYRPVRFKVLYPAGITGDPDPRYPGGFWISGTKSRRVGPGADRGGGGYF